MSLASILTGVLDFAGVMALAVMVSIGLAGAYALLRGRTADEISAATAKAGAAGFLVGIPFAVAAAIWLR